jgi:hypothetical protein
MTGYSNTTPSGSCTLNQASAESAVGEEFDVIRIADRL